MKKIKFVAIMMSLVMMVTFTPYSLLQVMADELKEIDTSKVISAGAEEPMTSEPVTEESVERESYIEKEIVEKRTENSKQFLMSDGMVMVQTYGMPIHYEENGAFKEIDNTLKLSENETGEKYFENTANSFKVRLAENLKANKGVSVENNGYSLEFTPNARSEEKLQSSKAELQQPLTVNQSVLTAEKLENTDALNYSGKKLSVPVQPNVGESVLVYENVFEGVDFEYSVNTMGVKEDIIVNCPLDDYVFSYTIQAPDLSLTLEETGEIVASSEAEGDIFVIPAPNMTDAAGVYSEEACYTLDEESSGVYTLCIAADAEWMNESERAYPVKIDPAVVSVERKTANGKTLCTANQALTEYNAARIKFGKVSGETCYALMSFPNENDQFYFSGYQLVYSKLKYYIRSEGNKGSTDYTLYAVQATVPFEDVLSLGQVGYDEGKSENPILLKGTVETTKVIITKRDAKWEEAYFNPESFNGCADMVFLWKATTSNDNQHGEIDVREGNIPSVLNYYVSTVGLKEDLPYEQFDFNGGTASVNLINGALTAAFSVLSIDVPTNPISLELVYNDNYNDIMTEYGMHNMFGNNIKMNFQQAKKRDDRTVRYIDADGSVETLCQDIGSGNPMYYSVNKNITFNGNVNKLFLSGGKTELLFNGDKSYRYYDASFIYKTKLMYDIIYSGDKITQIAGYTNGVKTHYIEFQYGANDRVSTAKSWVTDDILYGVDYTPIATYNFSYDEDGNLIQVTNVDSGHMKFKLDYMDGQLYGLFDADSNGYIFSRSHWTDTSPMRMSAVKYIYGNSTDFNDYYGYDYVGFSADTTTSKVTYYDAGGNVFGIRNVSRRFAKGAQSEWYEDKNWDIYINTMSSTLTGSSAQDYLTYTQNYYSTVQKENTTLSGTSKQSVKAGGSLSGAISANHGIPLKKGRVYCLSFKLESFGTTYVEVLFGAYQQKISLIGATNAYYIMPVGYYSTSTPIQIKNVGDNNIYVSDVSYNAYTTVKAVKKIETMSIRNYVTTVASTDYDYTQTVNYNLSGQVTSAAVTDYTGTSPSTKTYTYTYEDYPDISTRSEFDVRRLKSVSDGTKTVTYDYSNTVDTTTTTETVKSGSTTISQTVTTTKLNGAAGDYVVTQTRNGTKIKTEYAVKNGNVRPYKITTGENPSEIVTEYTYNYDGEVTNVKTGNLEQKAYYSGGNGKESSYYLGGSDYYSLTRDSSKFGLVTGISHKGSRMITYTYDGYGDLSSVSYANGASINYTYNYRRLQSIELKDSATSQATTINYSYIRTRLEGVTQTYNGEMQLQYRFSESPTYDNMMVSGDLTANYTYNYDEPTGRLTSRTIRLNDSDDYERTENFVYGKQGILQENGNAAYKTTYGYDAYDRLSLRTQVMGQTQVQRIQYEYEDTAYKTNRVKSITNLAAPQYKQLYSYNAAGYVESYDNQQTGEYYDYTYDGAGRLTSDRAYTYTYDAYNNITKKVGAGKTYTFTYDTSKKTRLKSVTDNGEVQYFSYDALGNITTYKGTSSTAPSNLNWTRGNMLGGGNLTGQAFEYKYGPDNLRYSKKVGGTETIYYWDGDILMGEKTGNNVTQYIYDASGIVGMIYNKNYFYFEKNLYGDVLKVYNSSGNPVAIFEYDSYGNVIRETGSMADRTHFRYRGYYYDEETGFYYLQSRYYDPSICRFISADQYQLVGALSDTVGQLNLYAYCNNNPIMYTDPGGESFITAAMVVSWIISTGIFAINGGISAHLMGQSFWRGFAAGAVVGAVVGGIFGFIGGAAGSAVANNPWFIMGSRIAGTAGYGLVNELFQYGTLANMNWELYAADIMMDFGYGMLYVGAISPMGDIGRALLQGVIETGIDALQTYLLYSPEAQARIRRHRLTEAERYTSGRRYEDKSRFYMNKLCVST